MTHDKMKREIKNVLENCACLGKEAYGDYIERMTLYIIELIEQNKTLKDETKNKK